MPNPPSVDDVIAVIEDTVRFLRNCEWNDSWSEDRAFDLRQRLEQSSAALVEIVTRQRERMFPIQGGPAIPWAVIAPFERQAQANHSQSLERLAQRGGLGCSEAIDVLNGDGCTKSTHPASSIDNVIALMAGHVTRTAMVLLGEAFTRDLLEHLFDGLVEANGVCRFCRARPLRADKTMCQLCWDQASSDDEITDEELAVVVEEAVLPQTGHD